MQGQSFLFSLVLLLFLGRVLGLLLRKAGQQELIGEVLAGFALGLGGFVLLSVPMDTISQFGILMIMLLAGLTTDFHSFKDQRKTSILVGAVGVVVTFIVVFFPLYFLFNLSLWAALFIAVILSNTAIEISAALLMRTDISMKLRSVVMGASFVDDIIAVFLIGIVSTMVFSNMAATTQTVDVESDLSQGSEGWTPYNRYDDSQQCFMMEATLMDIDDGDGIIYDMSVDRANASFFIYYRVELSQLNVNDDMVLEEVEIQVVLDSNTNLTLLGFAGNYLPTNTSEFVLLTGATDRSGDLDLDLNVTGDTVLYFAVGSSLASGNHSLGFHEISFSLELTTPDEDNNVITLSFLWQFLKLSFWIVVFLVVSLFIATRVLDRFFDRIVSQGRFVVLTFTLVLAFAFAILARFAGLHEVIGVYIAGLIIGQAGSRVTPMLNRQIAFRKLIDDLDPPIRAIFGPLFFGYIGVTLAIAIKSGWGEFSLSLWLVLLVILAVLAFAGKIVGCGLSAKYCGFKKNDAILVGIAMCGRGALEFVLLAFGLSSGIINEMQFSALVVVTLLTVLLTPLIFTLVKKKMQSGE